MELIQGLRLTRQTRAAFVGAGGKTTAVFQAARQFNSRLLVTTTTHLSVDQVGLADQHFTVRDAEDLPEKQELEGQVILFTGPEVEEGRVGPVNPNVLAALRRQAEEGNFPLLLESDGARRLPLKAPADHEPPIPDFVNLVVVVAGLSGLGKPLNGQHVHRPEIFSRLSGLEREAPVSTEGLFRVLTSEQGGLKNIPAQARKVLLINQIDAFPNWRKFHDFLPALHQHFHAVLFGTLEDELLLETWERIAGVVLAAGGSSRFGETKQLLEWRGEPFIRVAAKKALRAGLSPVVVVTGAEREAISRALSDLQVDTIDNPEWETGQGSSVRAAVRSLPEGCGGAVFLLADQPQIPVQLIEKLRAAHAGSLAPITAVKVDGQRANPVLFDRSLFFELIQITGDQGGRALFDAYPLKYVSWEDPGILLDVDVPEDYQRLISRE